MTHQTAISFSISIQHPFNRAGGRTSNVRSRMKILCQLEPNDCLEAHLLNARPRPLIKWLGLVTLMIFTVASIIHIMTTPIKSVSWTPLWIFGVIAYLVFHYRVLLPKHSKKIFNQQKNLQVPYEIEITEDIFGSVSEVGTSRFQWSDFHKYKQNKGTTLLYPSDVLFHIFQKRWFTDEEYLEFCRILELHLGKPQP